LKTSYFCIPSIYHNHRAAVVFALLLLFLVGPHIARAEATQIVIVPLKVDADSDLSFLKDGIHSILVSRLSWNGRITVLDTAESARAVRAVDGLLNESQARELGSRLGADYAIFGSVTVVGNDTGLDISVVAVNGKHPTETFSRQSRQMDEIIPQINILAEEINKRVFGREMSARPDAAKAATQRPSVYAHPERLLSSDPPPSGP
jgi:TolB-like protein